MSLRSQHKVLFFVLLLPFFVFTIFSLMKYLQKTPTPRVINLFKESFPEKKSNGKVLLNEEKSSIIRNSSQHPDKEKGEHHPSLPCDGTCKMQIQFCGYFQPSLPQGTYCCPETGCIVKFIYNPWYHVSKDSDAVILHHDGGWSIESFMREKSKDQVFILMTREAGSKVNHKSDLYNMTMTHRFDSDFRVPYGAYNDTPPENPGDFDKDWTKGKTKLAAWMASNCKLTSWPRSEFVHKLSKIIPIDMFGKCGDKTCKNGEECRKILRQYKFYFALENQNCKDYITEKFWYNALCNDVVPIVFGASREDYVKVAPPNSFIHLDDFSSMQQFVDYIRLLDNNSTLYNSFFIWKKHGTARRTTLPDEYTKSLICDIALKLRRKRNSNEPFIFQMNKNFWDSTCFLDVIPWSNKRPKIV